MSLLIIGGTGTLGRQIVLQSLIKGYQVRCLVRNFKRSNFLREWGAELIYGDLTKPETLPLCFKGITAVIDVSTSRPNELSDLKSVDLYGKLALIQCAKIAKIKKFIFYSAEKATKDSEIPLLRLKYKIECKLKESNLNYVIFKLTGFYQGLIEQYAIPILENMPILIPNEEISISYMDTQDIAKFCLRTLQISKIENQIIFLQGTKSWTSREIVELCEQLAGQKAQIKKIPLIILNLISQLLGFFSWTQNISDRLAFVNLLNNNNNTFLKSNIITYKTFKIEVTEIIKLDDYFVDYFVRLLKRLRDINFEDVEKQKNLII